MTKLFKPLSLVNAIQASRALNSSDVTSQPAINVVKETHSYCDVKPAENLTLVGMTQSIRIFLEKTAVSASPQFAQKFMAADSSALSSFGLILSDCAEVYGAKMECIHIYYEESGGTIAFNLDKSLFFNYKYFKDLHLRDVQAGKRRDALVYWYAKMAHELA